MRALSKNERQLPVALNRAARRAAKFGPPKRVAEVGMVVLALKNHTDEHLRDWMICEVYRIATKGLVLQMACPWCHAKSPGHERDFKVYQSKQKWDLDPRLPKWMRDSGVGSDNVWLNPRDRSPVVVAGSVTTQDWIECPVRGCTWTFKIDDSVVHTK